MPQLEPVDYDPFADASDAFPEFRAMLPTPVERQPATGEIFGSGQDAYETAAKKLYGKYVNRNMASIVRGGALDQLFGVNNERFQLWPERMTRSAATLPHDVAAGEVPMGFGMRREDYTDEPGPMSDPSQTRLGKMIGLRPVAAQPMDVLGERVQDLAGAATGGTLPAVAARGVARNALGTTAVPRNYKKLEQHLEIYDPNYVYHATNMERADDIASSGKLETHKPHEYTDQDMWPDGSTEKRNYFGSGNTWAFAPEDGEPTILRVKKDAHPFKQEQHTGDWFSTKPVPASKVEFLDHNGQWQLLLSDSGQVGAPLSALEHAPAFYSAVEHAVTNAKMDKASPEQWLGYLRNQPGVKQEELDWTGLSELGNKPLTKQQMLDHVNEHGVQVKEVEKAGSSVSDRDVQQTVDASMEDWIDNFKRFNNREPNEHEKSVARYELEDDVRSNPNDYELDSRVGGRYSEYQLPGGDNYREMLFTLPEKTIKTTKMNKAGVKEFLRGASQRPGADGRTIDVLNADGGVVATYSKDWGEKAIDAWNEIGLNDLGHQERVDLVASMAGPKYTQQNYTSSHWDEPNVLAHVRMNDRVLPTTTKEAIDQGHTGLKTLHLEELQSDWHQAGRKQGYEDKAKAKIIPAQEDPEHFIIQGPNGEHLGGPFANRQLAERGLIHLNRQGVVPTGVPDAPFKTTWPDLVLKRMIREAAEKGYDAISWTPGEQQAARYDLSKQVKYIEAQKDRDGTYRIRANAGGDRNTAIGDKITEDKLADYVGKDLAKKIVEDTQKPKVTNPYMRRYEGVDLKVGGEGMKSFYDKMLVDKANALAKKWGGKVEWKEMSKPNYAIRLENPAGRGESFNVYQNGEWKKTFNTKEDAEAWVRTAPDKTLKVPVLRLTPQLKDVALRKGFPLFSAGLPFQFHRVDHDPFAEDQP